MTAYSFYGVEGPVSIIMLTSCIEMMPIDVFTDDMKSTG